MVIRQKSWLCASERPTLFASCTPDLIWDWNCFSELYYASSRLFPPPSSSWMVSLCLQFEESPEWRQRTVWRQPAERQRDLARSKWAKCLFVKPVNRDILVCTCIGKMGHLTDLLEFFFLLPQSIYILNLFKIDFLWSLVFHMGNHSREITCTMTCKIRNTIIAIEIKE